MKAIHQEALPLSREAFRNVLRIMAQARSPFPAHEIMPVSGRAMGGKVNLKRKNSKLYLCMKHILPMKNVTLAFQDRSKE